MAAAWTWVNENLAPGQRLFLPAGGTPQSLYHRWSQDPSPLLRSLTFLQVDEILTGPKQNYFRHFFEREMEPFLSQFEWIQNADRTADAAILGVGINGHVAFHEPHLPRDFRGGCVLLSPETLKYLELTDPTWGITYGVGTFKKTQKILVLARGEAKQRVLRCAQKRKDLPVSWILDHPGVTLLTDFEMEEVG